MSPKLLYLYCSNKLNLNIMSKKKTLEEKKWSIEKSLEKMAKQNDCTVGELTWDEENDIDAKIELSDLCEFVRDNWKRVTGTPTKTMSYEQEFPYEVNELCEKLDFEYDDFCQEW